METKVTPEPPSTPPPNESSTIIRLLGLAGLILLISGLFFFETDFELVATGTVSRDRDYKISAPVDGVVEAVYFREGDTVEAGAIVLELNRDHLELLILGERNQLMEKKINLRLSELALREFAFRPGEFETQIANEKVRLLEAIMEIQEDLIRRREQLERDRDITTLELQEERIKQLRLSIEKLESQVRGEWVTGGLYDLNLERLELEHQQLKQAVALLEEKIVVLERQLDQLSIRAPIGGTLTRMIFRYPGQVAARGDFLFQISDPDSPFIVEVLMPERNIDLVRPGIPVRMESEVFDTDRVGFIQGRVQKVSPHSEPTGLTGLSGSPSLFKVEVEIEYTPLPLILGSRLQTSIILGQRSIFEVLFNPKGVIESRRASNLEEAP